jgi:hypothetical protein
MPMRSSASSTGRPDVAEVGSADSQVDGVAGQMVLRDGRGDGVLKVDEPQCMIGGCMLKSNAPAEQRWHELRDF